MHTGTFGIYTGLGRMLTMRLGCRVPSRVKELATGALKCANAVTPVMSFLAFFKLPCLDPSIKVAKPCVEIWDVRYL